jgi:hypothetical protein
MFHTAGDGCTKSIGICKSMTWRVAMKSKRLLRPLILAGFCAVGVADSALAQETPVTKQAADAAAAASAAAPDGLLKLSKANDVWFDTKRKAVVVDGQVCLREGQLEMFACPRGTKEHESVVSLNCQAQEVHAGLLAAGAKPGTTVRYDPEYKPASGPIVDIYVLWKDSEGGKHQARAQDWVKDTKTHKAMTHDWVFAGSGFWKDEETGQEHYKANGGDMVCVSNFPTAMLDLPIESSQANTDLMFEAFADRVPPRGTKVRVVFIPRPEKKEAAAKAEAK